MNYQSKSITLYLPRTFHFYFCEPTLPREWVIFLHKKAQRIYIHCASETMFLHRNHYSVFNVLFKDSNSIIILVSPITEYFFTTNCFRSLYSPVTTICIPSSASAKKLRLCAAIKQFSLSKENRTKGVLLIFNIRIFETTPFIDFITIASIALYIIATICFT